MKGLLLKDWYLTLKYGRVLLILTLVYGITGVFVEGFGMFAVLPALLIALLPNTIYSYDEREKWTTYAQVFPISRAQYVTGKYLLGVIAFAVYMVLLTVLHLIAGTQGLAELLTMLVCMSLLAAAIMVPLMFWLGVEKGRIAYFIQVGVIVAVSLTLTNGGKGIAAIALLPVPEWAIVLSSIVIYALSWRLSIFLYKRREL